VRILAIDGYPAFFDIPVCFPAAAETGITDVFVETGIQWLISLLVYLFIGCFARQPVNQSQTKSCLILQGSFNIIRDFILPVVLLLLLLLALHHL
jgi:hypothetical protein